MPANTIRFAGTFNAIDYAYGCVGSILPGALQVGLGSGITGAASLTVAYSYVTLPDSSQAFPLNTNAPITVGSGSNAETVTPSAVSNASINAGNNTCTVTATFANTHGIGDPISSGTFGLQEAINTAFAFGGGLVVVDSKWAASGGTTAMLTAAQAILPVGVVISDNRVGQSQVRVAQVTIPNALILTLSTVAQLIIPAQGAGTLIDVLDLYVENANTGVAYLGTPGVMALAYQAAGGASQTNLAAPTIAATFLTSPTVKTSIRSVGLLASVASSAILNTGVYLSVLTNNPTTGTGTLNVRVTYVVHTGL